MRSLIDDVRFSARNLRKRPAFTAVAVVALAIGIGANASIFSVVDAMLLRPPVAGAPERLVDIHAVSGDGSSFHAFSYPDFVDYRATLTGIELAAWTILPISIGEEKGARLRTGQMVSDGYFGVFGVGPVAGRFFSPEEGRLGNGIEVAVISATLAEGFGGAEASIGREVRINGRALEIVGVAPEGFRGSLGPVATDAWLPLGLDALAEPGLEVGNRGTVWLEMIGRLTPEVTRRSARVELETRHRALVDAHPRSHDPDGGIELRPFGSLPGPVRGGARAFMGILMGVVFLLLLVTSINVAGMLVARSVDRRPELALRRALGAPRLRLVRQIVTETMLLFVIGGVLAIALAHVATRILGAIELPVPVPLDFGLAVDLRVVAFTFALTLVCALVFAVLPALGATRVRAATATGTTGHGGAGAGHPNRMRLRNVLVVAQTAVALLLIVVAGLFLRALAEASAIDPGLDAEDVYLATVDLALNDYDEAAGRAFFADLRQRLEARPDIASATLAHTVPLGFGNSSTGFNVPGHAPPEDDRAHPADVNTVDVGYFETLGIRLLAGRDFDESDQPGRQRVAIVNETLANRFWPEGNAIGARLSIGQDDVEIVGIAAAGKYRRLDESPRFFIYRPWAQAYRPRMTVLARMSGATAVTATMRAAIGANVHEIDPYLAVAGETSLAESIRIALLPQRVASMAAATFGALGLLLVAIGVYGVAAYSVAQRTRELGIRVALGARRRDIVGSVFAQGLRLAAAGVALGLGLAWLATRAVRGLLFGVSATDPLVLGTTASILAAVVLIGCLAPAWRAGRIEPQAALRHDG